MSTYRIKIIALLCALAAGTAATQANDDTMRSRTSSTRTAPQLSANAVAERNESGSALRVADDAQGQQKRFNELDGKKLTGTDGEELGTIKDVVIDADTGRVVHVAVSTDGDDEKLQLVPQNTVQAAATGEVVKAQLDKTSFAALPRVDRTDLEAGRLTSASMLGRESSATDLQADAPSTRATGAVTPEPTPSTTSVATAPVGDSSAKMDTPPTGRVIAASKLTGREVQSGDEAVGTIETVAIDFQKGTASAVLKANSDFAGSESTFHVPFTRLEVDSADAQTVTTTLSRSEFEDAAQSNQGTSPTGRSASTTSGIATPGIAGTDPLTSGAALPPTGDFTPSETGPTTPASGSSTGIAGQASTGPASTTPASPSDEALTPTGREHASTSGATSATAAAIRTAIDADETLSGEQVRVQEAGRKIMLHGKVQSEDAKTRIEELARSAAGSTEVESKLKVEK